MTVGTRAILLIVSTFLSLLHFGAASSCRTLNSQIWKGRQTTLSDEDLRTIGSLSNTESFRQILSPILKVRRVGTEEHDEVRDYIVKSMRALGWYTELQSFADVTPRGRKQFSNIISTQYPYAVKQYVIACHYDTKWLPEGFVGAVDSAVPCAMMIDLATSMNDTLWSSKWRFEEADYSLQFMFFDGEEAFKDWTATDSIYGARKLAERLSNSRYDVPTDYISPQCTSFDGVNQIHRIATFMLLDLIGTRDTQFESLFSNTESIYTQLSNIEDDLRKRKLLSSDASSRLFKTSKSFSGIEDDHLPFYRQNVPILHLISVPFPSVWHTLDDNEAHLHWATIDNLNRILRVFIHQYFGLDPTRNASSTESDKRIAA